MAGPCARWPFFALTLLAAAASSSAEAPPEAMPAPGDSSGDIESLFEPAAAAEGGTAARKPLALHGAMTQETAYRVDRPRRFTKIRQELLLTESGGITEDLAFRATQRVLYDAVYGLTNTFPNHVNSSQEFEVQVRETYLDYSRGPIDVRIGKQQIVWGEALGLFFADIVNAKDLREFVLEEFSLIRIPQWGIDAEFSEGNAHAELVWLSRQFHRLGVSGSEFEFPYPVPAAETPLAVVDPSKPPGTISSSEVGGRLSYLLDGWDLGVFYLYSWEKFPVLFRRITGGVYEFSPQYKRAHYIGGSFSKDLRSVVLRGEFAANPRGFFPTFDPRDADGIAQRSVVDYLVGFDYTLFGAIDTNVQLLQRWIPHHNDFLVNEKGLRTHLSFWAKTGFFSNRIEPELLVLFGLSEDDTLYRPKIRWKVADAVDVTVGADVFQGERSGIFGRFDKKSRLYMELRYHF